MILRINRMFSIYSARWLIMRVMRKKTINLTTTGAGIHKNSGQYHPNALGSLTGSIRSIHMVSGYWLSPF